MRPAHVFVDGKCLWCGFRNPDHLGAGDRPGNAALPVERNDMGWAFHDDCPGARKWLMGMYLVLVLPFALLAGGWYPLIFFLILGLTFFGLLMPPRDDRWVGLQDVRQEYEAVLEVVPSGRRSFYVRKLEDALRPLFPLRDKAMRSIRLLAEQSPTDIEMQINMIRDKSQALQDGDLTEVYRAQIRDLHETLQSLEKLETFVEKFDASRRSIVASIRLLRNRIQVADQSADNSQEKDIFEELQLIHQVYARVNEQKATPAEVARSVAVATTASGTDAEAQQSVAADSVDGDESPDEEAERETARRAQRTRNRQPGS